MLLRRTERWCAAPTPSDPNPRPELHTYVLIPATRTWLLVMREPLMAQDITDL